MNLKRYLNKINERTTNTFVKIGGKTQFIYCGPLSEKTYTIVSKYLNRKVVNAYNSSVFKDTIILVFKSEKNDKRGCYWDFKEYEGLTIRK